MQIAVFNFQEFNIVQNILKKSIEVRATLEAEEQTINLF